MLQSMGSQRVGQDLSTERQEHLSRKNTSEATERGVSSACGFPGIGAHSTQLPGQTHTHAHTHTWTHTHAHTHTHTHMHTYAHTYASHMHTYTHMHTHMHTCARTHVHTHMHTHAHTHTHTHAHQVGVFIRKPERSTSEFMICFKS